MLLAYRRCRSPSCSVPESTSEKPMIEFSGVRSSWLMVARKSLFEPVHLEEGHVRLGQLVDLAVEVAVDLAQLLLHGDQVMKHPVERVRKLFELVAGLDLAADVQAAGGDRVGDVAEVLDRLDDHVADDRVRRKHRQDRRDQGGGDQHARLSLIALVV